MLYSKQIVIDTMIAFQKFFRCEQEDNPVVSLLIVAWGRWCNKYPEHAVPIAFGGAGVYDIDLTKHFWYLFAKIFKMLSWFQKIKRLKDFYKKL